MGNSKQTAISEKGNRRTGCADVAGHRQRGSMLVLGLGTLLFTILLLGFVVNYGHWNYKKSLIADVASAIAEAGIRNQLTYRAASEPPTDAMVEEMVAEQELIEQLNELGIGYEFGLTEDGVYTSRGSDPDPAIQPFNTMRVQVCTPLDDITGSFVLLDRETCVYAEAQFEVNNDCFCNHVVCPNSKYSGLGKGLCMLGCTVGSLLGAVLNLLFTLSLSDLIIALDCILDTLVISVNTVVEWVLGTDAIKLTYTRYT
jgi:hypothetical protein